MLKMLKQKPDGGVHTAIREQKGITRKPGSARRYPELYL